MFFPKKVKYRKWHKGRARGKRQATSKTKLNFGVFGLKALEGAWMTARQIEAARRAMTRFFKRGGKIWIRVFPDKPVTKKGDQSVMGSGKGSVDHYVAVVKPGMVLFEIDGIEKEAAEEAIRLAAYKLSFKTKFISK